MIRLTRPAEPPHFAQGVALRLAVLQETAAAGGFRAQRTFQFDASVWKAARDVLLGASFGKCAYCETMLAPGQRMADVEHFRPKGRAEGVQKGDIDPDHYWWLAYTWENLLVSCSACNRAKRNRFPVVGRRLEPGEPISSEQALLIDPFVDEPTEHLAFDGQTGLVIGLTERGAATIEILGLNRTGLVEERAMVDRQTRREFQLAVFDAVEGRSAEPGSRLTQPEYPYAAFRREAVKSAAAELTGVLSSFEPDVAAADQPAPTELRAVWIEAISITNFGCIRRLELDFSAAQAGVEPWIMLLGANGVGKSTILKAVALSLGTDSDRRRLAPDASRCLHRGSRADRGEVQVRFNNGDQVKLEVRLGLRDFIVNGRRPHFSLAGYGSTRLLPRRTPSTKISPTVAASADTSSAGLRLTNLFDPWASLTDAEPWLADPAQVEPDDFKLLMTSLKTLMGAGHEMRLTRRSGRLRARLSETTSSLDELSAGYQSILAFALDLSLAFGGELRQGFSTDNFEGLVLIDELEVHLHPEWKMRVVADLRMVFPHLQFIATTHDPLCLRGTLPGEIHLLQRSGDNTTVQQIDVPEGLDADEILTGTWFGLSTTLDAKVEADLLRYRALRLSGQDQDSAEITDLRSNLERSLGSYAGTSLGRVMVEAAGDLVAEQAATSFAPRLTKDQIKERLLAHAREHAP